MLLGTFVNEVWWPSCGKLRECTRVGYESAYRCHIQPKWADVDILMQRFSMPIPSGVTFS